MGRGYGWWLGLILCALVSPAWASDIEIVTSRFCQMPEGAPVFVDNSGISPADDDLARWITAAFVRHQVEVLDSAPESEEGILLLTFRRDRFVPQRPDDRSGFGLEVEGASGSGVHARIIVPHLRKDFSLQPSAPPALSGPFLTLDMRLELGSQYTVWLGRATAPLGRRHAANLERRMAERLVEELFANPPKTPCSAPEP